MAYNFNVSPKTLQLGNRPLANLAIVSIIMGLLIAGATYFLPTTYIINYDKVEYPRDYGAPWAYYSTHNTLPTSSLSAQTPITYSFSLVSYLFDVAFWSLTVLVVIYVARFFLRSSIPLKTLMAAVVIGLLMTAITFSVQFTKITRYVPESYWYSRGYPITYLTLQVDEYNKYDYDLQEMNHFSDKTYSVSWFALLADILSWSVVTFVVLLAIRRPTRESNVKD